MERGWIIKEIGKETGKIAIKIVILGTAALASGILIAKTRDGQKEATESGQRIARLLKQMRE